MDLSAISSEELTRLCVDAGESEAWMEFVRRFQKPIALTVLQNFSYMGSGLPLHSG